MARWDEILTLPVQNPPTLEFSAAELVWSRVEGWRDNIDRVALIPFARVDDFVRGESSNKDCPTRFHVEARRRRSAKMPYKPKVDGVLEYILYWCSFGPDDHRKGGIVRPSRSTYVPKKKNAGRPNTKRGCTCHFIVKHLSADPSVALIIYNEDKHVDKKGLPCHGPQDKMAAGTRALFAPYITEDLRLRVLSLLYVGVSVETIMQRHNESVERQGGPCNRDDLLTHRYVRRQERSIRRSTYELDTDDAVSVSMWVESHQSNVFFYEDFSDSDPFTLGIQTDWQLQQMIRFGNRSLVASVSRFGTNKLKYPVHSMLVFNLENKAIPVAWIIAPSFASRDAYKWMRALYNRVQTKDPTWRVAGFIVDDPLADIYSIRDVFQCSVLISFWRVRHAWHKNIVKKCALNEMRAEMSKRLGHIVENICGAQGTMCLFEEFMEDFIDETEFMDYFKATWYPRIGNWINALQSLLLASQETCAGMEFYHNQMKLRLLNEKDPSVYQRFDWLVNKLGTKVHSYFWLDEYPGKEDFKRYWKEEWLSGLTSWRKALKILDSDVVMEGKCAKVTDQIERDRAYIVWNPGSQFGVCDCKWAEKGNLCEHMIKVIRLCQINNSVMPSVSLRQYHQSLVNMLHCPPHDSLIRDHAVSLAVFIQKQISAVGDLESRNSAEQPRFTSDVCGKDFFCPSRTDRSISSFNEKDSMNVHEASEHITIDGGSEPIDPIASGNDISCENCGEEIDCSEMDVDPSSICISPPGLYSVDEAVSSSVFSENKERIPIDTEDVRISLGDDAHIEKNCLENDVSNNGCQESAMDIERLSIDIPSSTIQFVEQCTVTQQNEDHNHDIDPASSFDALDADISSNKNSLFILIPIDSEKVEPSKTAGVIKENGRIHMECENGSMSKIVSSANSAFVSNGAHEKLTNGDNISY